MTNKEAIEFIENDISRLWKTPQNLEHKEALEMAIKALEQEPKTGRWIRYSIPRCGEQHYQCTSCGYYINFGQWGEVYTKEFKYCPNCGAKMAESEARK